MSKQIIPIELTYTQTENNLVAFSVEQSSNGTTGWSTMINILSTNGTNTQTFTPTQPYVRVKFLSGNAFSLADMTLESVDVDTSYSLIARGSYRYGFNRMERDDELKGNGDSYDFGARMYDPRLGRWLSIDAVAGKKPHLSPYQSMLNNPIIYIDPDGNDEYYYNLTTRTWRVVPKVGRAEFYFEKTRDIYTRRDRYLGDVLVTSMDIYSHTETLWTQHLKVHEDQKMESTDKWFDIMAKGSTIWGSDFVFKADHKYSLIARMPNEIMKSLKESDNKDDNKLAENLEAERTVYALTEFSKHWDRTIQTVAGAVVMSNAGSFRGAINTSSLGKRMFLSNTIGVSSKYFGSSAIGGSQGLYNTPGNFLKLGWSTDRNAAGVWGYKFRIGLGSNGNYASFHTYVPGSFVNNGFANSTIMLRNHLLNNTGKQTFGYGLKLGL